MGWPPEGQVGRYHGMALPLPDSCSCVPDLQLFSQPPSSPIHYYPRLAYVSIGQPFHYTSSSCIAYHSPFTLAPSSLYCISFPFHSSPQHPLLHIIPISLQPLAPSTAYHSHFMLAPSTLYCISFPFLKMSNFTHNLLFTLNRSIERTEISRSRICQHSSYR